MPHALTSLFLLIFLVASALSAPQVSSPGAGPGSSGQCGIVAGKIWKTDANGILQCSDDAGAGTGAPTTSPYVTTTLDGTLTGEFALGTLGTGLLINTTSTGIPTVYTDKACTNQFTRGISAIGNLTCESVALADLGFDPATQLELDAHLNDTSAAHAASAISFTPAGGIAATDGQAAIVEALTDAAALVTAHTSDAVDAHAASAIGFTPNGTIAATTVQAAVQEVRDETPRVGGTSPCALDEIFKTTTGPVWSCATDASSGGGGTPGGATTQLQFNLGGVFAGDPGFTVNPTTDVMTAVGGFSGPLFGNATTSTALAANGANAGAGLAISGVDASGAAEGAFDVATQIELDAHINDTSAAHVASAIGFTPTGTLAATDVQAAIAEAASEAVSTLTAHESDTTAIHGIADTAALALAADARFPTANEKAAMVDSATGTPPSGSNLFVVSDDVRLPSTQTPAALSAASQINADRPTQIVTGSGGPVTLSNAKWLTDGDFAGQTVELFNPSATNTVTGPTTATIINCGGIGSVVIGLNQETPKYTWTGTLWQLGGCINSQHVLNSGPKLFAGLTSAAPVQFRGGTADAASTTGVNGYDNGAGTWVWESVCAGGACDLVDSIPATKSKITLLATVETERVTDAGVHTYTGIGRPRGTLWWDAAALKPDGTHCVAVSPTVNSGPVIDGITCAENAAAKLSAKVRLPDRYVGGTLFCRLVAHDVDTSGHISGWDARGQCRTPGTDAINATWGTAVAMDVTMTTAFVPYSNAESTITPNGTCVGGDMLFLELNMDTAANTDDGDAVIEGLTCEYLQGSRGD